MKYIGVVLSSFPQEGKKMVNYIKYIDGYIFKWNK